MNDSEKSREPLLLELAELRNRLADPEASKNHDRYRTLAESTTDIVYVLDIDCVLLYANRSAAECIGISQEALVGKKQTDLFPPDMARQHHEHIRQIFETGEAGERDELFRFGPKELWLNVRSIPLKDEQGRVVSVMGVCRDITDRKLAERELTKNKAILQAVIDCLPFDFFALGNDGRYFIQNAMSKKYWGDTIGKRPEDICANKEDLAIWLDNNRRAFCGEKVEGDVSLTYQGEKRFFHNIVTPIRSGETKYGILGLNIDITERKQAEEALRKTHDELEGRVKQRTAELSKTNEALSRSEERFRSYFEQGLMGMAVSAHDKRWVEINDRLCEILGYRRDELLQIKYTDLMHPGDLKASNKVYQGLMSGEIDHCTAERRYIRKDGNVVYLTTFAKCFHSPDGKADHIFALFEDVTQNKKAQQALQKEHRTLKHLLQSSDHERQLIAYEIHDGLAQQLAGAIMQFQIFDHLSETKSCEAAKAYNAGVTMLHQAHFESRRLIHGVRPPILDESGVIEAVAHLVHEEGRQKGPKIEFQSRVVFDRLSPILENAIYRIIQEALTNARLHSKSKKVRVGILQKDEHVRINIRDWGIGFSPDEVKENCYGLEGIRERARLLGGKCAIRTAIGKGTQVAVELPLVERD
jgi:PAS domain S-box-containing protein